jgi:hypothetical protein
VLCNSFFQLQLALVNAPHSLLQLRKGILPHHEIALFVGEFLFPDAQTLRLFHSFFLTLFKIN